MKKKYIKNRILSLSIISILAIFNGCGDNDTKIDESPASIYCHENNGTVVEDNVTFEELCQYTISYDYDDGMEDYNISCNLDDFYVDKGCLDSEDIETTSIITLNRSETLGNTFGKSVINILTKLNHTGYTHKYEGPFVLHPNYTELLTTNEFGQNELNNSIESYNLFLDCSGFVGYYVLQGIDKKLYSEIKTCYNTSRPLAADFADTFKNARYLTTDENVSDATLSDLHNNPDKIEWGRVANIEDAKIGDIIAYKHTSNIINYGDCNNTVNGGTTGHVLFIMSKPQESKYYKNYMLVQVADSTTAPHSKDSRRILDKQVFEQSYYQNINDVQSNHYTAWSKRYDEDYMELCDTDDNNTFHRRCQDFALETRLKIIPQSKKTYYSPTGIGIGYIYIAKDMEHYRVKQHANERASEIYIGRPVVYKELFSFKGKSYSTIVSPETNRTWLDRNLGASKECSHIYDNECIGDYYQWGREADGHQLVDSSLQSQQATSLTNVGDKFITYRIDWTSVDANGTQRSSILADATSGLICPVGFRVPTIDELQAEFTSEDENSSLSNHFLHLPIIGGYRQYSDGSLVDINQTANLWSSTTGTDSEGNFQHSAKSISYYIDGVSFDITGRTGYGYNIRCIKD